MPAARLSVALCTYNGLPHLRGQLRSILDQDRPADELVICDDRSTDQTVDTVRQMTEGAAPEVKIVQHPRNLGSSANFGRAIATCTGDVVVLADQDDLWEPNKLSVIERAFAADPQLTLAFSNGRVVDEQGEPLGFDLWSSCLFGASERAAAGRGRLLDVLLRNNVVTGATAAFRPSRLPMALPVADEWVHDEWLAILAAATGKVACIDQPLIRYRRHGTQQIGASRLTLARQWETARKMDLGRFEKELRKFERLRDRLRQAGAGAVSDDDMARIEGKLAYLAARVAMRRGGRRWAASTRLLLSGAHRRYGFGVRSWGQDLLLGGA